MKKNARKPLKYVVYPVYPSVQSGTQIAKKGYTIGHKPRKYAVYEDFQSKSNFAKVHFEKYTEI